MRLWATWVAVVAQTCELDNQVETDSRVLVAPVAFSSLWDRGQWKEFPSNRPVGYMYLPPISVEERQALKAGGYPADTPGAVVFGSTTLISRELLGPPTFGLDAHIRGLLQEKLTRFWTVRDWKSEDQATELEGMRIVRMSKTDQAHREKGVLWKAHLRHDKRERDEEITIGVVFKR